MRRIVAGWGLLRDAAPGVGCATRSGFDGLCVCVLRFLLRFPCAFVAFGGVFYHGARGVDGWVLLNETVVNPVRSERKQP